jgi:16S rRNA (cytosine967-C5)-methyltransferase
LLRDAWTLAIETLSWMEMQNLSEPLALARTVKQLGIKDSDALRLAHLLVRETVRRRNFIDQFINQAIKPKTIDEYNLGVQAFLRLYVYQTRIAKNWTRFGIEEAENIAKQARSILGWGTLHEVEAVLGVLLTQEPTTVFENLRDSEKIGLQTFHPPWFVDYCFKLFGRPETITMLEADIQQPPTYIRLNTLRADESEIQQRLTQEGVRIEKVEQLKHTYKVVNTKQPPTQTKSFREGFFYVQDKASCFAAEAANPTPEMMILDVCSAPGAKTTYLAQLMKNQGAVLSIDYSKRRIEVWKSEVARMGAEIAEPIIADARHHLPLKSEADVVVLDPPCTSTGVFRKLPSAKWRLTPQSIDRMAEIQWQMLENCAEKVKTGGTLVYSTCSITVEENEMLIERFLKTNLGFSLAEITPTIGFPGLRGLDRCQRLYPHIHQCNGFFIAKLAKEE